MPGSETLAAASLAGGDAVRGRAGVAGWAVRHRAWVVGGWVLLLAALAPAAARVEQVLDVSARVEKSESLRVEELLRSRFDSPFARYAVLVVSGGPRVDSERGVALLERLTRDVRAVTGVRGTVSWLDAHDPLFAPENGRGTFIMVGLDPAQRSANAMVPLLRAATRATAEHLRATHPQLAIRWSGDVALNYDILRTSTAEGQKAERRALPLTLIMLVVAFGTLVAALVSVAAGVIGIVATLGVVALIAAHWPLSILLSNVVSMIGLGLGIDYALLTVSRFREELAMGRAREDAATRAGKTAGHTILLSGCAVLIGFVALALIPLNELRAVAIGGVIVVIFSVLVAVTLLPALLAMLGERVNSGRLLRRRGLHGAGERWRRWGRWVVAHPLAVLLVAGTPLALLATQMLRMETGLPRSNWLPPSMESARALDDLISMERAGSIQALRVAVELPPATSALEGEGWRAVARIARALAADPRIERVSSLPGLVGSDEPNLMLASMVPAHIGRMFVSRDQRIALLEVLPRSTLDYPMATRLVRDVRASNLAAAAQLPGTRVSVGGMPAYNADYEDAVGRSTGLVVGLVLGGTLLALFAGFHSVLIPLKALALNLLSVAAALGAVVLVFQDGYGGAVVGIDAGLGSLFPALPVLVFCIVFGLSMDYEVFLVARVAEARSAGASEADAIVEGLARTGGLITGAAAIMIIVFAAFMLGDFVMIKVIGFALATAVLLDATIVRIAIGPALLQLAGRWNWWPGQSIARRQLESVSAP